MDKDVTLREHTARIGRLGGKARAAKLTGQERSDIASRAGTAGGAARRTNLSPERRKEIAQKAAKARWAKNAD